MTRAGALAATTLVLAGCSAPAARPDGAGLDATVDVPLAMTPDADDVTRPDGCPVTLPLFGTACALPLETVCSYGSTGCVPASAYRRCRCEAGLWRCACAGP